MKEGDQVTIDAIGYDEAFEGGKLNDFKLVIGPPLWTVNSISSINRLSNVFPKAKEWSYARPISLPYVKNNWIFFILFFSKIL